MTTAAVQSNGIERVLVLGHVGFIGSHIVQELRRRPEGLEVVCSDLPAVDLTSTAQAETLAEVFERNTAVVMCSGVKRQLGDTLDAFSQNVTMVVNVCRVLEQRPVRRFVFFSSTAVYGEETTSTDISESTPVSPTSGYGIAKYTSERLLRRVIDAHDGSSLLALRPPLAYGPGDLGLYGPSGFVRDALGDRKITLWGEGDELREFLFVEDLAALAARLVLTDHDGVLNAVRGESSTFRDAAEIVRRLVPGTEVESRPRSRAKADHAFRGDLLRSLFPDVEFTSLEDGIARTIAAAESVSRSRT